MPRSAVFQKDLLQKNLLVRKGFSSPIWKYFGFPTNPNDPSEPANEDEIACALCNKTLSYNKSTTVMHKHLKGRHPSVFEALGNAVQEKKLTKGKVRRPSGRRTTSLSPSSRALYNESLRGKASVPKRSSSWVWNYFYFPQDEETNQPCKDFVICALCQKKMSYHGGTSPMRTHIRILHKAEFAEHNQWELVEVSQDVLNINAADPKVKHEEEQAEVEEMNLSLLSEDEIYADDLLQKKGLLHKKGACSSPIWRFFGFLPDPEEPTEPHNPDKVVCAICGKQLIYTNSSTTIMRNHLEHKHPKVHKIVSVTPRAVGMTSSELMHVLFEHASGYGLFALTEFEEISMLHSQVEKSITEFGRFASLVKLHAFSPFKSGANALDNMNSVSEGLMHDDLSLFLETNLPESSKKRKKMTLGVGDTKMGAAIQEALGVPCQAGGVVTEVLRGLRYHFHRLVKGLTAQTEAKAQLGLGHSYSRCKVKFNVHRVDNMIIQSISLLDQLDKDINIFSMRIKEWYSYHFPELVKIVSDNMMYAQVAFFIKNRKDLTDASLEGLEEIVMDSAKAKAILDASRSSMGMDISPIDLINIERFATRVIALHDYRKKLHTYLQERMQNVAPNLSVLIGEQVGARLISHAGSLTNLAKYPASTVQILGAEKALFRALKTRGNTPKYGLIFHSTFIGRASQKNKGRISRYLANKCSLATRIDCFADFPTSVYGQKLRDQVEERLSFYETGDAPRKNIDVMIEAVKEAKAAEELAAKKRKKKAKKDKKRKSEAETTFEEPANGDAHEVTMETDEPPKKKKKKKKHDDNEDAIREQEADVTMETVTPKKKKKKKHHVEEANGDAGDEMDMVTPKKEKKKKKKTVLQ